MRAAAWAVRAPGAGHWAAPAGPMAAICCQALARACRAAGCSGIVGQDGLGRRQDLRPFALGQGRVQGLDLGRGRLLPGLQVVAGRGHRVLGRDRSGTAGQPLGPVELLVGVPELAPTGFRGRRVPGLGDLAIPPQGRAADLVPRQLLDPLQRPGRLAGVEVGTDLVGHPIGQAQPGRGQRIGGSPDPLGQVQVFDRAGQVVGRAPPVGPGNQVQPQPAAELHGLVMVRDVGPGGQGKGLFVSASPRGLLGLPQNDPPMSQHG